MTTNEMITKIVASTTINIIKEMNSTFPMTAEKAAEFQYNQMVKSGLPAEFCNEIIKMALTSI